MATATWLVAGALLAGGEVASASAAPMHGRAWELVSSQDASVSAPVVDSVAIDATGDRIAYVTSGPAAGAPAGAVQAMNMGVRNAGGWQSAPVGHPYSVPDLNFQFPFAAGASEDLSTWVWSSTVPLLAGAPEAPASGWYSGAAAGAPSLLGHGGENPVLVGLSSDARHVVFQTTTPLLPADAGRTAGDQVYEYVDGALRLVGVDGADAPLSACGVMAGSANSAPNPVSRDGGRIFLTSPQTFCGVQTTRVYLREDGNATTEISASRCTRLDCGAPADVRFMGATPSGSVAFLATAQQLTDDDVDSSNDLYRFDVAEDALTRVSASLPAVAADVVPTRAYPSEDGSRVYFLASGTLVPGKGTAGMPNLYVGDADGVRFVATLDPSDSWPWGGASEEDLVDVAVTPGGGRRILFATVASLRPEDTDLVSDLYLYDADEDSLVRVSGTFQGGNGSFPATTELGSGLLARSSFPLSLPRALSDDGRRVFFSTLEALVTEDLDAATDVYEWFDGEIALLTPSAGAHDAYFYGASPDGATAFFSTAERLVGADDDAGDYDLYAARLGGGFPDAPAPPPGCAGEACLPPLPGRLSRPDPASLTQRERVPRRLTVRQPRRAALRGMVAAGRLSLTVTAPLPGRVFATARSRLGGRALLVARGGAKLRRGGRSTVRLPLRAAARRSLAGGRDLAVRVVLRHSRLGRAAQATVRFRLKGAR